MTYLFQYFIMLCYCILSSSYSIRHAWRQTSYIYL